MRHGDAPPPTEEASAGFEDDSGSHAAAIEFSSSSASLLQDGFVRTETHRLRRIAHGLLASEHDRDDVVQDVWVEALQHPPRESSRLSAWLRVVTTHAARRFGRRFRSRQARERLAAKSEVLPSVLDALERESADGELRRWVDELKPPYRAILHLHFFDDCSAQEISQRLHRPEATVRSQLKRGLDQLRARYDGARPSEGRRRRSWAWFPWLAPVKAPSLDPGPLRTRILRTAAVAAGFLVATVTLIWLSRGSSDAVLALDSPDTALGGSRSPQVAVVGLAPQESPPETRKSELEPATALPPHRAPDSASSNDSSAVAATPGFVVSGRTVDILGTPIANAEIWTSPSLNPSEARLVAHSDSNGRYSTSEAHADLWIWAEEIDNGLTTRLHVSDPGLREAVHRDLTFNANLGRMRGLVRDPHGVPVAGAVVRAALLRPTSARIGSEGEGIAMLCAAPRTTDAKGRFEISRIHAPQVSLLVTAEGEAPYAFTIEGLCRLRLNVELPAPSALVVRILWPDGSPAEGVEVSLEHPKPLPSSSGTTDAQGSFRFDRVSPGPYTMIAVGCRDGKPLSSVQRGNLLPDQTFELDPVALSDAWTIRGEAQVEARALAGWTVSLEDVAATPFEREFRLARTSPDGRFAFAGCAGETYTLRLRPADARGGMPYASVSGLHPGRPSVVLGFRERTAPSAFVRGTLSEVGFPAGHAAIVTAIRAGSPKGGDGRVEAAVDRRSGRFELGPLAPGNYEIYATHSVLGRWKIADVPVDPGAKIDLGRILAPRTGTLLVSWSQTWGSGEENFFLLLDGQGVVLTGRREYPGPRLEVDLAARTARFRDLLPGDYSLLVNGDRIVNQSQAVRIAEDAQSSVDLTLREGAPAEFRVTGPRLLSADESVAVRVHSADGTIDFPITEQNRADNLDSLVRFRMTIPSGRNRIEVSTSGGLAGERVVEARGHTPLGVVRVQLH